MNQMNFPASEPNDSDDVSLALETAEALWNRGDPNEALRWLRRAAEAAGDSGDDLRAVVLAKAVAELNASGSDNAPKQVKPPPLPPQATHSSSSSSSGSSSSASHGPTNGSAGTDYPLGLKGGVKGLSKAPPAPPSTRKPSPAKPSSKPSSPPSVRPQASIKSLHPPPTPHKVSAKSSASDDVVSSVDPSLGADATPLPHSARPRSLRPAPLPSRHEPKPVKSAESSNGAAAHTRSAPRSFARAALRVYVPANARVGDKLEVYLLHEGQEPPAGAVEAMLVPLARGTKLLE